MTNKKKLLLVVILLPLFVHAQFRKYANEFLNIGVGGRGLAMGGSTLATVKDGTAGYWNPAGLVGVEKDPQLSVMHAEYFSGIAKYDYASLALPSKTKNRTLAVSLIRFAIDDIPNTLFLREPDGTLNFNNIQSFSNADYALLLSYAQKLKTGQGKALSFGVNSKIIYRTVGSFANAIGFGFDAGLQYSTKKWRFGAVVKDVTTTFNAWQFKFSDREKEQLYLTNNEIPIKSSEITLPRLVLGAAKDFKIGKTTKLTTEANFDITFDGQRNTVLSSQTASVDPRIGLELNFKDGFFIRGGVSNFQRGLADSDTINQKKVWLFQPSMGAGVKLNNVMLDYAFTNLANQNNPLYTHVFSLRLTLDKKNKK
jgi:hypothetical protein